MFVAYLPEDNSHDGDTLATHANVKALRRVVRTCGDAVGDGEDDTSSLARFLDTYAAYRARFDDDGVDDDDGQHGGAKPFGTEIDIGVVALCMRVVRPAARARVLTARRMIALCAVFGPRIARAALGDALDQSDDCAAAVRHACARMQPAGEGARAALREAYCAAYASERVRGSAVDALGGDSGSVLRAMARLFAHVAGADAAHYAARLAALLLRHDARGHAERAYEALVELARGADEAAFIRGVSRAVEPRALFGGALDAERVDYLLALLQEYGVGEAAAAEEDVDEGADDAAEDAHRRQFDYLREMLPRERYSDTMLRHGLHLAAGDTERALNDLLEGRLAGAGLNGSSSSAAAAAGGRPTLKQRMKEHARMQTEQRRVLDAEKPAVASAQGDDNGGGSAGVAIPLSWYHARRLHLERGDDSDEEDNGEGEAGPADHDDEWLYRDDLSSSEEEELERERAGRSEGAASASEYRMHDDSGSDRDEEAAEAAEAERQRTGDDAPRGGHGRGRGRGRGRGEGRQPQPQQRGGRGGGRGGSRGRGHRHTLRDGAPSLPSPSASSGEQRRRAQRNHIRNSRLA